jgi:hypothetical protein
MKTDITQINIIYMIQQHPRAKLMDIHLDGLVPYWGGYSGPVALRREQCDKQPQRLVACNWEVSGTTPAADISVCKLKGRTTRNLTYFREEEWDRTV